LTDTEFIVDEICHEAANGHYVDSLTTETGKIGFLEQMKDHIQKGNCYNKNFGLMNFHGYIAEVDGKKAGYSVFRSNNNVAEIWFFGLTGEYQGQKLSCELLDKTIDKIGGDKITILARCLADSKAMMHILQKRGFTHWGKRRAPMFCAINKLQV
jgi:RimJ/RimL family protein N-acetyltransferase